MATRDTEAHSRHETRCTDPVTQIEEKDWHGVAAVSCQEDARTESDRTRNGRVHNTPPYWSRCSSCPLTTRYLRELATCSGCIDASRNTPTCSAHLPTDARSPRRYRETQYSRSTRTNEGRAGRHREAVDFERRIAQCVSIVCGWCLWLFRVGHTTCRHLIRRTCREWRLTESSSQSADGNSQRSQQASQAECLGGDHQRITR